MIKSFTPVMVTCLSFIQSRLLYSKVATETVPSPVLSETIDNVISEVGSVFK